MEQYVNIWVICTGQTQDDYEHVYQLLGKGKDLCKAGKVTAVFVGKCPEETSKYMFSYGADEVKQYPYTITSHAQLVNVFEHMIMVEKPDLILYPANTSGKILASELATSCGSGLTAECIDIQRDKDGSFLFIRTAIGSSVIATITCKNSPVEMCTVKKNSFPIKQFNISNQKVRTFSECKTDNNAKDVILYRREHINEEVRKIDLEHSKLIFGFGRGIKTKETMELLFQVAQLYGADVGCTRAIVDEGWLPYEYQIGQSGISVNPEIYIAFGISGASQHMVGVKNSKHIIAVNADENAPIFEYSNYKIVDDTCDVLNELYSIKTGLYTEKEE